MRVPFILTIKSLPMKRGQLLGYAAMLCAVPRMALANGTTSAASGLFLSAATDPDEQHWVVGFSVDGPADAAGEALDDAHKSAPRIVQRFRQRLPERAHDIAINPQRGFFVVLARRPGTWLQLGSFPDG